MEKFKPGASAFWLAVIMVFTTCLTFGSIVHADCFTQEQLDDAVADERKKWDAGEDGKIALEEAIRALQVVAGLQEDISHPNLEIGAISVSGTGKDTFQVFDSTGTGEPLASAKTNENVTLYSGEYTVFLNKSVQRMVVRAGKKEILTAGVVSIAGNGDDRFYVYDETGTGDDLAYAKLNEEIELLPGQYTLSLNKSRQLVTVEAGEKTVPIPGILSVSGTGDDSFYVYYDDQSGSDLAYAKTNEEINLFSGDYIVSLNRTQQTVSIQDGETVTLTAGRVRLSCITSSISTPRYDVYDPEKGPLGYAFINRDFELFPGDYIVSLHDTTQTANVQAGEETLLVSGTLTVSSISTSGHATFYVHDDTGNQLGSAYTNKEVELFPGTYTVSLNDTLTTATVQAGEKTVVEAGTVWVSSISTSGNAIFRVYDDTRNELDYAETNQDVELFPGTYTVSLNNTERSATVRSGERTVLEAGTAWVSSILTSGNAKFYVCDAAWDKLDEVYTNKEAELFPGTYTVSLNETRTTTTVQAGERSVLPSGVLTVLGTDGSYFDVYDSEGNLLTHLRGDKAIELFPGTYSVVLDDAKLSASVVSEQNVSVNF